MTGTGATGPILGPVDIEQHIVQTALDIERLVGTVSACYDTWLEADRVFDKAWAAAFLNAQGPQGDKRVRADQVAMTERQARDVADVAYQYSKSRMKAMEQKLSALQSVLRSMNMAYGAAGHGQG